ncbi:MAG: hypothetical protein MUO26_06640 [Methanotrichaceae archaeon]|nr:hypothetical protein [Methanotrichaceae archaeon]
MPEIDPHLQKIGDKGGLYLASTTLSMVILASFSTSFTPPADPAGMVKLGAAAPATGAAAGAAAAGSFFFSLS